MKVKLKLPVRYFAMIATMGNQLTIDNSEYNNLILAQSKIVAFQELRQMFLEVSVKHSDLNKKVSKQIPTSYCLLFFGSFYGLTMEGYMNVVIKEICSQIENQLFKSGKYKLTL